MAQHDATTSRSHPAASEAAARSAIDLKRLDRDHRRRIDQIRSDQLHATHLADLALVAAKGILRVSPDEAAPFEVALAALGALDADGVVFARMGSWSGDTAGG